VGPGFTISLTRDGQPVTSLDPGIYVLTVQDRSAIHNFRVFGLGLDTEITSTPFVGTVTMKMKVKYGEYTFVCDPHATSMRGTFDVPGGKPSKY
jgi:plastocyanin